MTGFKIYDIKAMLDALHKGALAGVADDAGGICHATIRILITRS